MKDILIVEDGNKDRERLEKLFEENGYSVVACESVGAAEEALRIDAFRLAILDIGLSDKSGSYLFNTIQKVGRVSYIVIFTGNPSVHLKQRFLDDGAADYIVKASPQAHNDAFLARVKEIIGAASEKKVDGIPLTDFLDRYVDKKSRSLFLDSNDSIPECSKCGGCDYVVTFSHNPQIPPAVKGTVVCSACGEALDPEVE